MNFLATTLQSRVNNIQQVSEEQEKIQKFIHGKNNYFMYKIYNTQKVELPSL